MEVIASSTFIRQTPRKILLVADQIRGLRTQEAMVILKNLNKQAAEPLLLTLKQGIGNAVNNFHLDPESLKIKKLEVSRGPIGKRWRFVARGRVHQVQKKSSHVKMVLEGEEKSPKSKIAPLSKPLATHGRNSKQSQNSNPRRSR